ncbi:MAG: single-stranded DNA-binding protein [Caldilinea sp.]|mgnify:CR=1 FL=1|nr:single-stranded DNA-binding protein [Caldilinea sp.]MCB0058369.1 single-stranded DNA-binding protein [Caldilineaceae bacterium]MCB0042264.1 single-stranded DNA-binding protein [Caldilinea sp.]MCB0135207.1 single-stranded DNA-binding protein [Caldilineaceae bacterium]MCB0148467.1 single-stranded DNA-binding protein [Caldilineaceae bacterium]
MYQQITMVGNLGNDPEMRYTPNGVPVTSFSLAVNKRWVGQDGQSQEKTLWFRVTAWRKLAETASQYLTKGRQVLVVGELEEPRTFVDRNNATRVSLDVTATEIRFLGRPDGGHGDASMAPSAAAEGGPAMSDEDIPF